MDNFTYNYLNIGSNPSNRLGHVSDAVNASANTDDIESQSANNYSYDELGQLIGDQQEQIANIEWRSGDKKIKEIIRTGNNPDYEFKYNPLGQRILKIEKPKVNNVLQTRDWWRYTYYTYDANGQVMATYEVTLSTALNRAYLKDQNIYGASRIGMRNKYIALYENATVPYTIPEVQQNTLGNIAYEITNYLGNVNVVISDRKLWVPTSSAFKAVVLSRTDYFPFGMEISSRTAVGTYRYGYTGKEEDNEINGNGNSYDFGNRQYDPRIGRWLSLDPLKAMYPSMSPYCYAGNTPISTKDPDGRLIIFVNGYTDGPKELGLDCKPNRGYWGKLLDDGTRTFLNESSKYFKGDINYWFEDGNNSANSSAKDRFDAGHLTVMNNKELYRSLIEDAIKKGEGIHFVTHSMGAAYAEGMIQAFSEMGFNVTDVVHFSPADSKDIKLGGSEEIKRTQICATGDLTLTLKDPLSTNSRIPGVKNYAVVNWSVKKYHPNYNSWWRPFDSHFDTKNELAWKWLNDFEEYSLKDTGFKRTRTDYQKKAVGLPPMKYCFESNVYSLKFNASDFKNTRFTKIRKDGVSAKNIGSYSNNSDKYLEDEKQTKCD